MKVSVERNEALTGIASDLVLAALKPSHIGSIVKHRHCPTCGDQIEGGPVLFRGSTFCSVECAATAAIPGLYLG
jgi:hypothetical protein